MAEEPEEPDQRAPDELEPDELEPDELSPEELEAERGEQLPERSAMSPLPTDVTIPVDPAIAADVLAEGSDEEEPQDEDTGDDG